MFTNFTKISLLSVAHRIMLIQMRQCNGSMLSTGPRFKLKQELGKSRLMLLTWTYRKEILNVRSLTLWLNQS